MYRHFRAAVLAAILLLAMPFTPIAWPQTLAPADEQILKAAGVKTDTAALLEFLARHPLKDGKMDRFIRREATACAARLLALRKADGALEALLGTLPIVDDAWLEEEVLASLGRLAIGQGQPDARLLAALKDQVPARRAAVLYLLGRRADVGQRAMLRAFLADGDPLVRAGAAEGLLGKHVLRNLRNSGPADDATLKAHNVAPTEEVLLGFLRQRTPDAAAQARLAGLITELGVFESADRAQAAQALVKAGAPALAFLRPALQNADPEISRRARHCLDEIQRGLEPGRLSAAVVRRLAWPGVVKDVPTAVRVLLNFVPFAEDELLDDEVLTALQLLSTRHEKLDASLTEALGDPLPARRAAAAFVLASVGTSEQVAVVRKLRADAAPMVQFRTAQGLLAARDKAAVPKLIALYGELSGTRILQIEEALNRLAGAQVPPEAAPAGLSQESRRKAVQVWQKWWQQRQDSIDLIRADGESFLGLVTVCEYDNVALRVSGQVWEAPRNAPASFKIGNLAGPMDAQILPNGRILVAENGANRVTERDRDGAVKWTFTIQVGNPICCQRLPNGNTFIALYNQLLEVGPDSSEIYRFSPGPQFYIFCARKTRTGTVICVTAQGTLLEIDPLQSKTIRTINLAQPAGGWASVEPLPNGNFLLATMNNSTVREVDQNGKDVWSFKTFPGVFRATLLPNGNVLVASMNTREVAEIARNGVVRWKHTCEGRPWSIHVR